MDALSGSPLPAELKRKAFHALSAVYALLYALAGRTASLWTLGMLLVLIGTLEAARLRTPALNAALIRSFGGIHRESEVRRPSGILWTLTGCFLTIALVPQRDIVLAALGYLALGDGMAALVGRRWGHLRIGAKSLEGSLACFLSCWLVGMACLTPPFGSPEVIAGALAATVLEALPMPLNDNLWMPLFSALLLMAMRQQALLGL